MAVYDDERQKTGISDDELRGLTGISKDEEGAMEREAYNGAANDSGGDALSSDELSDAESNPSAGGESGAESAEKSALTDNNEIPFKDEGVRGRFKFGRKQVISGGVAGLVLGGSLGLFSILQGPFQVIHFMQWIDRAHFSANNEQSNKRVSRLVRYMRAPDHPERRRLGIVMNNYADKVEIRWRNAGYEPIYGGAGNTLSEFRIRADVDVSPFEKDGINVSQNPDGTRTVMYEDLFQSGRNARRSITAISEAAHYNKAVSTINTRILAKRAGVRFKFFSDVKRAANESTADYYSRFRTTIAEYYGGNPTRLDVRAGAADEDGDGVADDPNRQAGADEGNNTVDGVQEDIREGGPNGLDNAKNRLSNDISRGTGLVDLICLARGVARLYPLIQYTNIVLPMIRTSTSVLSMGSQIMAGRNLNMDEVGAISTTLSSNDGTWVNAKSVQAEMGMPQTGKDISPAVRPSGIGKNRTLDTIDDITSRAGMGGVCAVNDNIVGGAIITLVSGAGVGGLAFEILVGAALAAGDIDIVDFLARLAAGEGANKFPRDEEIGNYGMYGGRLAASDQALGVGGRELTEAEEFELDEERRLAYIEELSEMSIAERLFSPHEPGSLVSKIAVSGLVPQQPSGALSSLAKTPGTLTSALSNSFTSLFIPKTYAQTLNNGYDYGFPSFGYTATERDDPRNEPVAIVNEIYGIIDSRTREEEICLRSNPPNLCDYYPSNMNEFNALYGKCFGTRIIEADINADPLSSTGVERFEQVASVNYLIDDESKGGMPSYCRDINKDGLPDGQPDSSELLTISQAEATNDLRLYRFYLNDIVTGHSMACYEGHEPSCDLFNIDGNRSSSNSNSQVINGFQFPLQTTKSLIGNRSIFANGTTSTNHPYTAYDIYVPPRTPVVAATGGRVTRVNPSSRCSNGSGGISLAVIIYNEQENKTFFYTHLEPGSQKVSEGQSVEPGALLGEIGGESAGCFTTPHLHIDASNGSTRGSCSRQNSNSPGCPTVDLGPALHNTYQTLPE